MCGISGIYSKVDNLNNILINFNKHLKNRGPNNSSYFVCKENYFGMAHTRLSILDLSDRGNQPMCDYSGDWIITYNGEIYNHLDIRKILSNNVNSEIKWKSSSDTETILTCNTILGFKKTLNLLEGMFAFALYNKKNNKLFLARDRVGEKPLFYYHKNNKFIFGSDISIFEEVKSINLEIDRSIIPQFLEKGYISAPNSIYKNIKKLEPGNYLTIEKNFLELTKNSYWSFKNAIELGAQKKKFNDKNFLETKKEIKKSLISVVNKQCISDVKIGSFLSGGIDSSLITSILQKNNSHKVKTFTVGFKDKNYDESVQAKKISNFLGTEHYEYFISKVDLIDTVKNLNKIYSEPFADTSQIPTFLISKMMKNQATVILSGDGGDEFFGGYNRYLYLKKIIFLMKILPKKIKNQLSSILQFLPISVLDRYLPLVNIKNFENKINKFVDFINCDNIDELYNKMICLNPNSKKFLSKEFIEKKNFGRSINEISFNSDEEKFMYLDQIDYLPDDILCKVDRATMYNSIESRAPFLDHKLIEQSWTLPINYKIKNNQGKIILREILSDYLPKQFHSKTKSGFSLPINKLLRTDLCFWVEEIINSLKNTDEFFNYNEIKFLWEQHKNKKINAAEKLWPILIFQDWLLNKNK